MYGSPMKKKNPNFERFVRDYMGGDRNKAAKQLGVSIALVGHLMTGRRGVSIPTTKQIEFFTCGGITRHDLRPDVYGPAPVKPDPPMGAV